MCEDICHCRCLCLCKTDRYLTKSRAGGLNFCMEQQECKNKTNLYFRFKLLQGHTCGSGIKVIYLSLYNTGLHNK